VSYCNSRYQSIRRLSAVVNVGAVGVGGSNPIRIQSMTTSDTQDVAATVLQSIALAEVGCEIVRVTAPNVQAARCLREIRRRFSDAGFAHVPLVADIHFLPQAAMEAVEHVEKVRVNPGNYADTKRFAVKEYSDSDYNLELERLHESFSPLVLRARELGRSLRIGTNHGSLSDRIMNRYGDTPLGMVESALEFLRIAESHGFRQLILSMKSSNPKVMIQAYRLLVERMQQESMAYPLHLGVTEAGDGEDGRIKSAIGIGSLLLDGLGDTIRVSLTEDSVYEIPVARAIAGKAMSLWGSAHEADVRAAVNGVDPYRYARRETRPVELAPGVAAGGDHPPRVLTRAPLDQWPGLNQSLAPLKADTPAEGLIVKITSPADLGTLSTLCASGPVPAAFLVLELTPSIEAGQIADFVGTSPMPLVLVRRFASGDDVALQSFAQLAHQSGQTLAIATTGPSLSAAIDLLRAWPSLRTLFTLDQPKTLVRPEHAIGAYRTLAEALRQSGSLAPLWIRNTAETAIQPEASFLSRLLESSILTGTLLCDGLGDAVSIETEPDAARAVKLSYNVLQGAGARISKTEFVACPSCGRTLFDLQTTTQRIRSQTGHLKGVKIAIMGCIVNGPGEMADADFGYVGGAPGKINLYVGKTCVQYNLPQIEADARLIALIRERGKWVDPVAPTMSGSA